LSGESGAAVVGGAGLRIFLDAGQFCVGVRVSPSAQQTAVRGMYGERLKVAVVAPPEDNRANRQLEEALAGWLGFPRDTVRVLAGHGSRDKVIGFAGVNEEELRGRLLRLMERHRPTSEERQSGS
jgi:uncharacterized protein YggU (UPF0235/DUF167 family)